MQVFSFILVKKVCTLQNNTVSSPGVLTNTT